MSELRVMDGCGDTKIIWDSKRPEEVKVARETFNKLRKKGYNAYSVRTLGEKGEIVTKFDPDAEKIILAPPMSGG